MSKSDNIIAVVEDRMERALRGEKIDWKGPGFTYGEAFRNGTIGPPPTTEETIQRAIAVNEVRLERPLTGHEKEVIREAIANA